MNSKESEATMKRNIRVLLTLMGMVWATVSFAQTPTVTYEYDDCGNRIERIIGFKKVEENGRSLSTPMTEKAGLPKLKITLMVPLFRSIPIPQTVSFHWPSQKKCRLPYRLCFAPQKDLSSRVDK